MATNAQIVSSISAAQALMDAGSVSDQGMLSLAYLAVADLLRGHVTNYKIGGRDVSFSDLKTAQAVLDYFRSRVDAASNGMAMSLGEFG